MNRLQSEHAVILKTRDDTHQAELRQLDAEKTRREIEYLDKIKRMNEQHAAEV